MVILSKQAPDKHFGMDSNTCDLKAETNNTDEDPGAIVTVLSKGNDIN